MTHDLRQLTETYVSAFHGRDIDGVRALMDESFVLTDPDNPGLGPRDKALAFVAGLFENAGDSLSFVARQILVDGDHSVIEFDLTIGDMRLEGVDLIEWRDGLMVSMRAHLTQRDPAA